MLIFQQKAYFPLHRALQGLGIILCRNAPGQAIYQKGLTYLQHTRDIFSACGASIDLDLVQHTMANLEKSIAELR